MNASPSPVRATPWNDRAPVREELFGIERLEQHARSLAEAQPVSTRSIRVPSLHKRLDENAAVLLAAYRAGAVELEKGRAAVPAAEWLLDNYHLVEEQVRDARNDLPPGFYRQLPKLADGPFAGYPRVFGIAWAYVAHTDSHFDPVVLRRFIDAYQSVQPLTIGELWAVAITLRIVLLENLRRLTDQITVALAEREEAEALADRVLATEGGQAALDDDIATRPAGPLSDIFAAQLAKRLRDLDPATTPALMWFEQRLAAQGASVELVVERAHQRQAVSNVTVRNIITSMRRMSDISWSELFERVSLVDARLREGSAFASMDFPARNLYRSAIEQLARGSTHTELEIAGLAVERARRDGASLAAGVEAARVGDPGYHLVAAGRPAFERELGFRAPLRLRLKRLIVGRGIGGYVGAILLVAASLLAAALIAVDGPDVRTPTLVALGVLAFLAFTDAATALVNRGVSSYVEATALPGLDLLDGVPASLRTLVVVPTLLTSHAELCEQIERLEVHYLSGADGDVHFALLTDWPDAEFEMRPEDLPLLALAVAEMAKLNNRHGPAPTAPRFLLLHRRRLFNASERRWISWERKRGKLEELNRLLRGNDRDELHDAVSATRRGCSSAIRFVITLDSDTQPPDRERHASPRSACSPIR